MHGLTKEQLAIRQVETLDIASDYNDYWSYIIGASNLDFSQFQSAQTGRGPLLDGWQVGISSSLLQGPGMNQRCLCFSSFILRTLQK